MFIKPFALFILYFTTAIVFAQQNPKQKNRGRQSVMPETLIGSKIPDLNAYNTSGELIKLQDIHQDKYLVLSSGCLTCPHFHRDYGAIETAYLDYADQDVIFSYFYKSLRHPELNGFVEAQNISERLLHIEAAKEKLKTNVPWLADTMQDEIKTALLSNSESVYLISPKGQIVYASSNINADELRSALEKHIGPSSKTTAVSTLNLPRVKRSVLPENVDNDLQVERPTNLKILTITPSSPLETYYVKLRAEIDPTALNKGEGKLYLSFFPDPIYDTHWNNLVPPMKYQLTTPNYMEASPIEATAQKGEGESDTKPRQFVVDIKNAKAGDDIKVALHYFGCTPTMCEAMTHEYTITLTIENNGAITAGFNKNRAKRNPKRQTR